PRVTGSPGQAGRRRWRKWLKIESEMVPRVAMLSTFIVRRQQSSNPSFLCGAMDCFAALAMTVRELRDHLTPSLQSQLR
ncbi:hypothetical protein, partial [Bradyrhizobium sp.]|uniref:hypothetical protein n=1 Tax=Bradyrhizobium sp. TaxID=376 RepID=UPI003C6B7AA7